MRPDGARALPVLVLVGGPGGCGKSTLARLLGHELPLVHVCRDTVKAAIAVTEAVRDVEGRPEVDEERSAWAANLDSVRSQLPTTPCGLC